MPVVEKVKFRAGNYMKPATLTYLDDGRIQVGFGYSKTLIAEIKSFEGARWQPDEKKWVVKDSQRNRFQLAYLMGGNPYERFDLPLIEHQTNRKLYDHQAEMVRHALTRHYCIFAVEPGCGKSLAAIEIMEASGNKDWFWVAPKSALRSVELELEKWRCAVRPRLCTYEGLRKIINEWPAGKKSPIGVIFDESQRVKNPTAQRSQAAMELAEGIRRDWGDGGFVILMSGTPAPKSPADWWHPCEVACPGFLKEGTYEKFKRRLAVIVEKESIQGGVFPELVAWRDDPNKCNHCGQLERHPCHDAISMVTGEHGQFHNFEPGVNEVRVLYERMKGLVLVKFKKDVLDLPEKRYEVIRLKPSASTLRAASIITAKSTTVVGAMTLLRELSDGFQYQEEEVGTETCSLCYGNRTIMAPAVDTGVLVTEENVKELEDRYPNYAFHVGETTHVPDVIAGTLVEEEISCPKCGGSGETAVYRRETVQVATPKEEALKELLDVYDDVGRVVLYAGFSGSVDRVAQICRSNKWETIKVDGRGWEYSGGPMRETDMIKTFQSGDVPRVAFVGQPSAAGLGLTLTASPMICFWSNDFNAESRQQAEERIHRPGMDYNRGATIYDLVHLPTDEKVLVNLKKKRDLQAMSMGELSRALDETAGGERAY
jgi:SNF2 family DNA or RNA helicase